MSIDTFGKNSEQFIQYAPDHKEGGGDNDGAEAGAQQSEEAQELKQRAERPDADGIYRDPDGSMWGTMRAIERYFNAKGYGFSNTTVMSLVNDVPYKKRPDLKRVYRNFLALRYL